MGLYEKPPPGATCLLCTESFDIPHEVVFPVNDGSAFAHQACLMRSVVGGVNHQRGTCSCCGGSDEPDPPGASRREAALMAFDYYLGHRDPATVR